MLELKSIIKDYAAGDGAVRALDGITVTFRKSEFVSVLGPSGCGKTTLLNIVGGLDGYTQGDLIIGGRSTREFRAYDWDAYRNNCVGFVFQNYNLIPHLSVLGNVELALTLSGESKQKRREKATAALERVGLGEQLRKRPNQLSGGQMQRVAIARAIVNDPEIILADEPTGALDSHNSVQIAELLREISRDRLVIMVTHNDQLADEYSTRIIRLLDGKMVGDTDPYTPTQEEREAEIRAERERKGEPFHAEEYAPERYPDPTRPLAEEKKARKEARKAEKEACKRASAEEKAKYAAERKEARLKQKEARAVRKREMKHTSMAFTTALGLSGRNLATKKGRTALVSFAGSIGIIGIALVLSISNGFTQYIDKLQTDTLAGFPITITPRAVDVASLTGSMGGNRVEHESFPTDGRVEVYSRDLSTMVYFNDINDEYLEYIRGLEDKGWANAVDYINTVNMNIIAKDPAGNYKMFSNTSAQGGISSTSHWSELVDNPEFMQSQYSVEAGKFPTQANELALVIDKYNRINLSTTESLGLSYTMDADGQISYEDILKNASTFKVIVNDNYYRDGVIPSNPDEDTIRAWYEADDEDGQKNITLNVVGILRIKEGLPLELYGTGLVHTKALTKAIIEANKNSAILATQQAEIAKPFGEGKNILENRTFSEMAGLTSRYLETWKNVETQLRTFLKNKGISDEEIEKLIANIVSDPTLSFIEEDSEEAIAFKEQMQQGAAIISTLYKMVAIQQNAALESLGAAERPTSIYIYPKNFDTKKQINNYLDTYNDIHPNAKVMYTDASSILADTMGSMVDIISYVLIAFAAVSLVVSGIMIAIITYVSVIERTKEIGVLRSIGARKKDISRVFNAETVLIGAIAGVMGVIIAVILNFPINIILHAVIEANGGGGLGIGNLAVLHPLHGIALICISIVLTLISGLIPSQIAAKKDPVTALRTE